MIMKTETGFEYEVAEGAADDAELFDDLLSFDEGSLKPSKRIAAGLIGEDGQKRLYDFCRNPETGRVSLTKVYQEISYIITHLQGPEKNS